MSRYMALMQERADLIAEGKSLFEAAEREERALTEDEKGRDDAINLRLEALAGDLDREERRRKREREASAVTVPGEIRAVHNREEDAPWAGMGEFFQAVAAAGTPGGTVDPRLYAGPSGMNTSVPSEGGFAVRTDWSSALMGRAVEQSQLLPMCMPIEIGENSDGVEVPYVEETSRATGSRWGGVRVYRRAEAETVTATNPKLGQWDLRLEDLMGLAYTTERLRRDAVALESVLSNAFASEFGFRIDDEIIRGTGAGQCLGILNSDALVTVAKEDGQSSETIVTENLSKMWAALHVRSRGRAIWFYNQDCEPQLDSLSLVAGTGALNPRVVTYNEAGVLRIKGRPAMAIEQAETLGTVGDIMLADLSQYGVIRKGGTQYAESIHVRFIYAERAFRWIVAINGQPTWKTSLTPYKGTQVVSPFVALATRS